MKSFLSHTLTVSTLTLSLATHVWSSELSYLDLPVEIHKKIILELPIKDVGAISLVNKGLSEITQNKGFQKIYIDQILINAGRSADDLKAFTVDSIQKQLREKESFIKKYIDTLIKEVVKYDKDDIKFMTDPFKKLAIAANAHKLFQPDMDSYKRAAIIAALEKVPADIAQAIVANAHHLFTKDMKGYQCVFIIRTLAHVPADRAQAIVANAHHLFTQDMDGYSRDHIISALAEVPADRAQAIVAKAHHLFTQDMSGFMRATIISNLAQVPAEEIASIQYSTIYSWGQFYASKLLDKLKWFWKPS